MNESPQPTLFVVATPIGNLGDMTYRSVQVLKEVGAIACEDTRRTRILLSAYSIPKPEFFFSYHNHNEIIASKRILGLIQSGVSVALCSDSGYPGISDPGYRVLRDSIDKGIPIEVLPGASAIPLALLKSGIPAISYTFKGFPPRKKNALRSFFEQEKELEHTLIFFESPFRILVSLQTAKEILGNRSVAVCFELTKKFERIERGYLSQAIESLEKMPNLKGEITVVIAGNHPKFIEKDSCEEDTK